MIKHTSELLHLVENAFDIKRYSNESNSDYHARVTYSLAGRWMLASIFDETQPIQGTDIDNETKYWVSIHHAKQRFKDIYTTVFSPKSSVFSREDIDQIADYAYQAYLDCGYFYHQDLYISRPQSRTEQVGKIQFLRGLSPEKNSRMCGLGPFLESKSINETSWKDMFDFDLEHLIQAFDYQIKNAKWSEYWGNLSDLEFLNIDRRYNRYWTERYNEGIVSLARTRVAPYRYSIYKVVNNNNRKTMMLANTSIDLSDGLWVDVANAILLKNNQQISHKIVPNNHYYEIHLKFLLPSRIQGWLNLYSWPLDLKNINPFHRLIRKEVFDVIRPYLEQYGFKFEECNYDR